MLNEELLRKIENKEITSRRKLYKFVYRNKQLINYLNENNILIPKKYDKNKVILELKELYKKLGRLPKSTDCFRITCAAQNQFGSWNEALYKTFNLCNKKRYSHLSNEDLKDIIIGFIKKYNKLPLREEFDGKIYPYFETYFNRFKINKWSDIYKYIDISDLKYFSSGKMGKIIVEDGVVYFSNKEYQIGRYLKNQNIKFLKEVPYGNSNYVFDFFLPDYNCYIEYYGICTKEYKQNIENKRKFYNSRKVIELFKYDNLIKKLSNEVQRLQLSAI